MKTLTLKELDGELAEWPSIWMLLTGLAASVFNATPNPRVGCVIVKDGVGHCRHIRQQVRSMRR